MQSEEERWIGYGIKAVNNLIRRKLDSRFVESGLGEISGIQGPVLGYLSANSRERDVFQRDIEKKFRIRRSTATVMLQNLEQKGYIVRTPVEQDARRKRIVLTEKAVKADQAIRNQVEAFNKELESGITLKEKEAFFAILDKVIQNLS